eukprot:scaffold6697_cov109-Skeletonema_dohrnii-CCMP3373.AAC.6
MGRGVTWRILAFRSTKPEACRCRVTISWKLHLAASPVTSAAAAAASSLPNASPNNSNASETDELVNVVSNDAEDEGGAANNVDTDRSGSVEAGAKDEDGGGEEERTILQDGLSASDEHVVELTSIANLLLGENSTEDERLKALDDLQRVLLFGRNNNTNKYAAFVWEFKGLLVRLEQMQKNDSQTVYDKIVMIFRDFFGVEEEVTETESTETSLGHDAVDSDATQDDFEGQPHEHELQGADTPITAPPEGATTFQGCFVTLTDRKTNEKWKGMLTICPKTIVCRVNGDVIFNSNILSWEKSACGKAIIVVCYYGHEHGHGHEHHLIQIRPERKTLVGDLATLFGTVVPK